MYFVFRFNLNADTGAESHSEQRFDDEKSAMKRYYNLLAADIDNENFAYELVQVIREDGIAIASQVFDNRVPEVPTVEP